jgi:hypothetical protein
MVPIGTADSPVPSRTVTNNVVGGLVGDLWCQRVPLKHKEDHNCGQRRDQSGQQTYPERMGLKGTGIPAGVEPQGHGRVALLHGVQPGTFRLSRN